MVETKDPNDGTNGSAIQDHEDHCGKNSCERMDEDEWLRYWNVYLCRFGTKAPNRAGMRGRLILSKWK